MTGMKRSVGCRNADPNIRRLRSVHRRGFSRILAGSSSAKKSMGSVRRSCSGFVPANTLSMAVDLSVFAPGPGACRAVRKWPD